MGRHIDGQVNRQTDTWMDRRADKQTDRAIPTSVFVNVGERRQEEEC